MFFGPSIGRVEKNAGNVENVNCKILEIKMHSQIHYFQTGKYPDLINFTSKWRSYTNVSHQASFSFHFSTLGAH